MKLIYLIILISTLLYSNKIQSFPSFQGFRGAINTPNSEVMKEGDFEFLYTNQVESLYPSYTPDYRDNKIQKNFFLNMGILPGLDLNFQYAYGYDNITDIKNLSNRIVNFKYQIPFIPKDIIKFSIGSQDFGGGNPYIRSYYTVASKDFKNIRTNIGYAIGDKRDKEGSIDGIFGSIEYQPLSWLQLVGEYDTKEWNSAIKAQYTTIFGEQRVNLGLMAKSSLDYNDIYFGVYANMPFLNKSLPIRKVFNKIYSKQTLDDLKLANTRYIQKDETIYFEYENNLYVYNDIDTLGVVLGILTTTTSAKTIQVAIKKSNIIQYTVQIDRNKYKEFLKDGKYKPDLLQFNHVKTHNNLTLKNNDRFKPILTISPDFILVDGGEYSDIMDYTLALQAELSMRLAKGTIVSGRYNIPISQSDNFKKDAIFDYRNRQKTSADIDQLLLTKYLKFGDTYPLIAMAQAGLFDKGLQGISIESGISDSTGKHHLLLKIANLEDSLTQMDRYTDHKRNEQLLSYRYYFNSMNSNIKLTIGEFLYGDKGEAITLERYFNDLSFRFDISHTKHLLKGENNLVKLTLSIPFGPNKQVKTNYLDIRGGKFNYIKRKTLVTIGNNSFALPHHLKEIDNSFTLENYYLNNNRFQPNYIQTNYHRLRNSYLNNY